MNTYKCVAFNVGIESACQMALTTAVTIKVRDGANRVQHHAVGDALQASVEGASDLMLWDLADEG